MVTELNPTGEGETGSVLQRVLGTYRSHLELSVPGPRARAGVFMFQNFQSPVRAAHGLPGTAEVCLHAEGLRAGSEE